jgi:hypothetical protein
VIGKILKIPIYLNIAREVSQSRNRNMFIVSIKIVIAKIHSNISPHEYALNDFEEIPFRFWNDFIHPADLLVIQKTLNPESMRYLVDNKIEYYLRCSSREIPTPRILAIISRDKDRISRIPQGTPVISDEKDLRMFLDRMDVPRDIIIKIADGAYGVGLMSLRVDSGGIFDNLDQPSTVDQIYDHCFSEYGDSVFIVQERLKPHRRLEPIMPGRALGCVRVVTHFNGSEVEIMFVFLKIPVGDNTTDAFQHGATGNLLAYLGHDNGKVGKAWGKRPGRDSHCLTEFTVHPTTGVVIQGFQIPQWEEILSLAREGAKAFPELRVIGWDVALCENGIFLIEGNNLWDADGPQIALRRGIKKMMMTLA